MGVDAGVHINVNTHVNTAVHSGVETHVKTGRPYPLDRRHFTDQTLTEENDTTADTYKYDSDADAAAFGGDQR